MSSYETILAQVAGEFDVINPGLADPATAWQAQLPDAFALPPAFEAFVRVANGLRRVEQDQYFSLRVFPVAELRSYVDFMNIEEDVAEEDFEFMELPAAPLQTIVVGGEGEYGFYLLNCARDAPGFGNVHGIINNIPECFRSWSTFAAFVEGFPAYCRAYPLATYREAYVASSPRYGND